VTLTALLDEIFSRLSTAVPDYQVYLAAAVVIVLLAILLRWLWKSFR